MVKEKFFWGDSSSSMQTEGAWKEGGKGLSVYDAFRELGFSEGFFWIPKSGYVNK